jgi:parallel beta-helix repeat protein
MKYRNFLLAFLASFYYCSDALATTFYVDAKNGKDSWNGKTSAVSNGSGPWQSIAKVNSTPLKPGDQVLFSCGQTWYDTLKPNTNGLSTAKISFSSFPNRCDNKPKISGFLPIPANNWQLHQGSTWKTTFPLNLIINSNFSSSVSNWSKWPADANLNFNPSCPASIAGCLNFQAGSSTNSSIAISNPFPIIGGQKYKVSFTYFAANGFIGDLVVRENGNSYRSLGLNNAIFTGNDQWKTVSFEFIATNSIPNARLDIEVPKSKNIYVKNLQLQLSQPQNKPQVVLFNGDPVSVAHHPNNGHDISNPQSIYLRTSAPSPVFLDQKGRKVSSQIAFSNLKLPSDGSINPGTKLKLRDLEYEINDFSVSAVGTNTLSISPNTSYPLSKAGWGFYFYDDLWMLDSANEWFFEDSTKSLYLWTPTNSKPDKQVSISALDRAIDLRNRSNVMVENIEIDGAAIGLDITKSANVALQYLTIHNINLTAIDATQSVDSIIANNKINRIGLSSASGINAYFSKNVAIENNDISEVGVFIKAGKRISLPMTSKYGIYTGYKTFVSKNHLSDIAGYGIIGHGDNDIDANIIERSCLILSDCGAIYVSPDSLGSVISNNMVLEVPGNVDGTPDTTKELTNGIYLDDGISGIEVSGNIVKGARSSIHLHNSGQNTITNNIFYGGASRLIYQQEDSISNGGLNGNTITNNQLFPTTKDSVPIFNISNFRDVHNFATYDKNQYSVIYSPVVASENAPTLSQEYSFPNWQDAKNTNNLPRDNDINSAVPAPLTSFSPGLVGQNFLVNGDFSQGLQNWKSWNANAPFASKALEGCLPVSDNCLHFVAGASHSLISSPKFAILKGKRYRVTVDIKSTVENQTLFPMVLIAGPTKFTALIKDPPKFTTSTEWKRHAFIFEAKETASNPTLNDQGARFDIGVPSGLDVWVANLEIVPFDFGVIGPSQSSMLVNTSDVDKQIDCPTRRTTPSLCSSFVIFPEAKVATWPLSVPPRSGRIVFTQNLSLLDSDGDTIADPQDSCPSTLKESVVNAEGCSLAD